MRGSHFSSGLFFSDRLRVAEYLRGRKVSMNGSALVMTIEMIEGNFTETLTSRRVPADRIRESPEDSIIMKRLSRRCQDHFLNRLGHTGERQPGENQPRFP